MISDVLESWAQKLRVGTLRGPWEALLVELRKCHLNSSDIHLAGPDLQVEASLPSWTVCQASCGTILGSNHMILDVLESWVQTPRVGTFSGVRGHLVVLIRKLRLNASDIALAGV